jgi:hypothetical protein
MREEGLRETLRSGTRSTVTGYALPTAVKSKLGKLGALRRPPSPAPAVSTICRARRMHGDTAVIRLA